MMNAVREARHGVLAPLLDPRHLAIGSINSPMQCMMKEVCAQCLQKLRDPQTGKERVVFTCFNQDQELDAVDFRNLRERLRANSMQEKLSQRVARRAPQGAPDVSAYDRAFEGVRERGRPRVALERTPRSGGAWRGWGSRGPEWFVRWRPPVVGLVACAWRPSARRAIAANLRRRARPRGPLREAVDVARTFTTYASCLAEVLGGGLASGGAAPAAVVARRAARRATRSRSAAASSS